MVELRSGVVVAGVVVAVGIVVALGDVAPVTVCDAVAPATACFDVEEPHADAATIITMAPAMSLVRVGVVVIPGLQWFACP